MFTNVLQLWLKKYLFTTSENWNVITYGSCALASKADLAWALSSGPQWKGGSAAISEYKCARIAQIAAMGQKSEFFSAEKAPFSVHNNGSEVKF
jgi:hypothetical protein